MVRYAIIDTRTKKVVNICEWDGVTSWLPPENTFVIQSDIAGSGDIWDEEKKILKKDFSKKTLM